MGTSLLCQDDAYTFLMIHKTLEAIIPALILSNDKTQVIYVLKVFVDAFAHIPSHRRLELFRSLLICLGQSQGEAYLVFMLFLKKAGMERT